MLERVGEMVRVGAVFGPGPAIRPVWFDWRSRKYTVRNVTMRWSHREGENRHLHFAVTDGMALYELVYDTGGQIWRLESLDPLPPSREG